MITDIKFEIKEHIGVLAERDAGDGGVWTKELNIVSWNEGSDKWDIRDWNKDHDRMSRGLTLTDEEVKKLYELLKARFKDV